MCTFWKKIYLKHKALTLIITPIIMAIVIMLLLSLSTYIPRTISTNYNSTASLNNKYISERTLGGENFSSNYLAPENTLAAFKASFENNNNYKIDMVEINLHITSDSKLILLDDNTIDNTSDCRETYKETNIKPENKTYAQLLKYNMGYNFEVDGTYPYRTSGADLTNCRIITLDQVLAYLETEASDIWKTNLIYNINIKNSGDLGKKAINILYEILTAYNIIDNTVVSASSNKISNYIDTKYPTISRSASVTEISNFYFNCIFGVNLTNKDLNYSVLKIPYNDAVINLGKKSIVDYAHKYGIAVVYYNINNKNEMEHLDKIGADAIISNNPQLVYNVINNF